MYRDRRKFLAGLVADSGKVLLGTGAITQVFVKSPDWQNVFVALVGAVILFVLAFLIYPKK